MNDIVYRSGPSGEVSAPVRSITYSRNSRDFPLENIEHDTTDHRQGTPQSTGVDYSTSTQQITNPFRSREVRSWNNPADTVQQREPKGNCVEMHGKCVLVTVAVSACCLLFIILMSMSFSTLHYYEYGFLRDRTTGVIDRTTVYGPGGWFPLGPSKDFKRFQADGHFVLLQDILVFTKDKLEIKMTVNIVYFLRREDLILLLDQYDVHYEIPVKNSAKVAIKAATTVFTKNEFILERQRVEKYLFKAVREKLEGICCRKGCEEQGGCLDGCKSESTCKTSDRGMFVEVRYFQMTGVDIPDDVHGIYLKALTIQEETNTEFYKQEVKVMQKQTEALIHQIKNLAAEIKGNATVEANLILAKANSYRIATVEEARATGMKYLTTALKLESSQHQTSYDYLTVLRDHKGAHMSVDYNNFIKA